MLVDLRIENLAVVERAHVCFRPGLNVISGETGAGKSILLAALSLALGGRASSDLVRHGADAATIEARFELSGEHHDKLQSRLERFGLPRSDALIVRRRVSREGKSRVFINDASATVGALATVTADLVELTGQHDQFGLLRSSRQRDLLDASAVLEPLVAEMARHCAHLREQTSRHQALLEAFESRGERDEFLRFYLREYDALEPQSGEDETLADEADGLQNSDRLRLALSSAVDLLHEGQNSAYDLVQRAENELSRATTNDGRLNEVSERLISVLDVLHSVGRDLSSHLSDVAADPIRLEEIESRLHSLQRLCRKHSVDLDGLIERMQAARAELLGLQNLERRLAEQYTELDLARVAATRAAEHLHRARSKAVPVLVAKTMGHLEELGFLQAVFDIALVFDPSPDGLTEFGGDTVQFELSTNPGEPPRPLQRVASGGELSRTLLALKCALAEADSVPVQVLDEIDSGLGGGTAEIVGRKIRDLADHGQVLCVTHLPQIASFADNHLLIVKSATNGSTSTTLLQLSAQEREDEVARMLGGTEITNTTREHAREMLDRARAVG